MKLFPVDMSPYGDAFYPSINPILLIDTNGIYPALREGLIKHLATAKSTMSGVFDSDLNQTQNTFYRSSSHCNVSPDIYERIKNRLDYVVDWQMSQQQDDRQYVMCEPLQFLRYEGKNHGKFLKHTDNAYFDGNEKFIYTSPKRLLSTVTFLNDDFEGGELVFSNIHTDDGPLVIKPKAGVTVIFPSDLRYPHEVKPVTAGTRYSLVGWYGPA